jgi:O-acetylserine/cysteine efflux transporter
MWWLGERFQWRTGAAIVLSFFGVMVLGFDRTVLDTPMAMALMLVSALFLAIGTVLLRGLRGMDPVSQQGWAALIGVGPLLVWSALSEPGMLDSIRNASWVAWSGIVYAAVVASLIGHGIYYVLMQRHPVAQVTPFLLATPLLATGMGIIFLGDVVGPRVWIGGAMVLVGVLAIGLRNLAKARIAPVVSEL